VIRRRAAIALALAVTALVALANAGCAGRALRGERVLRPAPERPGLLLVTLRTGAERSWRPLADRLLHVYGLRLVGSWPIHTTGELCLVVASPPWLSRARATAQLEAERDVSGAYPLRHYRVLGASEPDPHLTLQSEGLGLPLARLHRAATGRGVSIAVIDTGVDIDHPELTGRIRKAVDFAGSERGRFTAEFHGTAVAGVVAALAGNGRGGSGIAPEAELWAMRACWQEPRRARTAVCDSATLVQALDRVAIDRPRIVNLSLAGEADPLIERLIRIVIERGTVVIAAAKGPGLSFPASVPGVVAVDGAWRRTTATVAAEPAAGALVAPGSDLLTTIPDAGYDFVSGSSFAAAWTTGLVALLLEHGAEPSSIGERLRAATGAADGDGSRRIDGCAALAGVVGYDPCAEDAP
jgi:subtilisin family serine protease